MKIIILCIFYISPIIDSITGYFMGVSGEDNSISKLYRIIAFSILYISYFMLTGVNKIIYQVLISAYSIFLLFYYWLCGGNFIIDCSYIIKLFYPIMLISMSKIIYEKHQLSIDNINKVIDYYSLVYPLTIIIFALLGIGHSAYGGNESNGHMGLFSGGNEISIVLAILFMVNIQRLYTLKINKKFIIYVIISGFALLMTQTKTSYIIVAVILTLYIAKKIKNSPQKIHKNVMIIIAIVISIIAYAHIQQEQIMIMINRLTFKYQQLGNNFLNMIFSNRQNKILPIIKENYTFNIKGMQNFLFGNGFYLQVLEKNNSTFGLVEMDLFDILFQNGVIMLCVVMHFYWCIVKQSIKSKDTFIAYAYIMALAYSILAGHVLYNPLSSTALALLCIYVYANKNPFFNKIKEYKVIRQTGK